MAEWNKLVVGLGNPGDEYEWTAHNLGFLVVDRLAVRNNIRVTRKEAMAFVGQGTVGGKRVLLAKPQTYMNLSGPSVKGLAVKYEIAPEDVVVISDDLDLPWGSVRIRPSGSHGGHHGLESVMGSIGTQGFPRVRLGIHGGRRERDGAKIVLGQFSRAQRQELEELLDYTAAAVESIIAEGVEKSMTKFNRRAGSLQEDR